MSLLSPTLVPVDETRPRSGLGAGSGLRHTRSTDDDLNLLVGRLQLQLRWSVGGWSGEGRERTCLSADEHAEVRQGVHALVEHTIPGGTGEQPACARAPGSCGNVTRGVSRGSTQHGQRNTSAIAAHNMVNATLRS